MESDLYHINATSLPFSFPFYNKNYRNVWINPNGAFSFSDRYIPPYTFNWKYASFPLADQTPTIAGFWRLTDSTEAVLWFSNSTLSNTPTSYATRFQTSTYAATSITSQLGRFTRFQASTYSATSITSQPDSLRTTGRYYQIHTTNKSNKTLVQAAMLVNHHFPNEKLFSPKMVLTGTWSQTQLFEDSEVDRINTFQIVAMTDEQRTFTFLFYNKTQSANNTNFTILVGFNAGDGTRSYSLPYREKALAYESNVNVSGLFAFRTDTYSIQVAGCQSSGESFSFYPKRGSQFGGTAIDITSDRCFHSNITCKFNSSIIVQGFVLNEVVARCLTPFSSIAGLVNLSISLDGNLTFLSIGEYQYMQLKIGSDEVTLTSLPLLDTISLQWIFPYTMEQTFPNSTTLNIDYWEITVRTFIIQLTTVIPIKSNLSYATNSLSISASSVTGSTGIIRVTARYNNITYGSLNTGVLVLNTSVTAQYCSSWISQQPSASSWNSLWFPCPMTLTHAYAATWEFQEDSECCWLNQGRSEFYEMNAIKCFSSTGTNEYKASAQCCYDRTGQIISRGTGAGRDAHYQPLNYPTENFFADVLPFISCCKVSVDNNLCNAFLKLRPTRRGSINHGLQGPHGASGGIWGDPHYMTLDGAFYTFNGYGEYIYLAISNVFMSQVRTIPLSNKVATITNAFVAKSNETNAKSVSVRVSRRQILVYRDNKLLNTGETAFLSFPEMTINRNVTSQAITLTWLIGVAFQITRVNITTLNPGLVLNVAAAISGKYIDKIYRLLGFFDGNSANDFRCLNGTTLPSNSSEKEIHDEFGRSWAIDPNLTLMNYDDLRGSTVMFYTTKNKETTYINSNVMERNETRNVCKISSKIRDFSPKLL
ncbi:unnamed protein product [Didymodactylos carnosus]|uniref:Uncharacterized protein n=1 Tax=Didymodactylos carnosus TaxID=1234261 RepID=A0A813V642_9BILA|nr:unnamed protein product [Didymodactylos carnosus]CAF3624481.1 unnamed protein product [Didymodactylos carnosus]